MEKLMCGGVVASERAQILEDNCDKIEFITYMKPLYEDDILREKTELSQQMIELNRLERELAEVKLKFKDKMKPARQRIAISLDHIRHEQVEMTGDCFKFIDGDTVGYYDQEGELVYERRSTLDERKQGTIFQVQRNELKSGTNN